MDYTPGMRGMASYNPTCACPFTYASFKCDDIGSVTVRSADITTLAVLCRLHKLTAFIRCRFMWDWETWYAMASYVWSRNILDRECRENNTTCLEWYLIKKPSWISFVSYSKWVVQLVYLLSHICKWERVNDMYPETRKRSIPSKHHQSHWALSQFDSVWEPMSDSHYIRSQRWIIIDSVTLTSWTRRSV